MTAFSYGHMLQWRLALAEWIFCASDELENRHFLGVRKSRTKLLTVGC